MGKKVVISQDKLLVLKENVVGGNKAANHNTYYVNEARPEIDKYEIGAESNNPPLGGNGYHVEENLSEVREIPRELIDMAIKYKDNKYANWCVIDDVYVNMVPRYFEKKSFAVDYKRWLGRGILVNLAKYENNVNEDYSRNKLRYYNEGVKPQGDVFYENKKIRRQIVENKYDDLFSKAYDDLQYFQKQCKEKYGTPNWYISSWMEKTHPEISVDPKDVKIYTALNDKLRKISKLWNDEDNKEEKEETKQSTEYYDVISLAIETYGTTSNLSQAGYILPDGKLLSFGYDGYRDVDHRAIEGIYKENNIPIWSDEYRYNYVVDFMNHGAIRCDVNVGLLDMTKEPTNEQFYTIKDFVRKAVDVDIDFTDDKGNTLHSVSYSDAKPQAVVADIMRYYNEGIKPQGNVQYEEKKINGKSVITESQESKSIAAAKKLVMQRLNYNEQEADEFIRIKLRNDIPVLRTPQGGKFILGAARMFCDGELRNANDIGNLNSTLKLVASDAHINEYDRNLNGMSAQELIQRFAKAMSDNLEAEKAEIGQMVFNTPSDYEIVRIDSFEQAEEYGDYVSWCVTHNNGMFNSYTSDGMNQFYFCLKNGFKNVEKAPSEGCPLDEYGLSMIAVSVNENGMLNTCTCRWNHDNGGDDSIMNAKQVSQVIGMNFFEVFKPNNKWKDLLTSVMQRLENGEDPRNVFDYVDNFREGFARVNLNWKYNFINQEGRFLSDQWFDNVGNFSEGFAGVNLNNKYNFINQEGRLISDQWFDYVGIFREGFANVNLNNKYNFINQEGRLISDQWFDDVDDFSNGFAKVKLNWGYNFINQEGRLSSDQWFDNVYDFSEGFAKVVLNGKWNFINQEGRLISDQWFDDVDDFRDGFAEVELNRKYNFINQEGRLLSDQWFDYVGNFRYGFAEVELNGKSNYINQEGRFLSDQWFDDTYRFVNGFARVKLNGKDYRLDTNGNLTLIESKNKIGGKNIIIESQESKSIAAAKKLVMQRLNYNEQEADEFIRIKLRNDIPTLRTPQGGKFILGVARMFCDGELRTVNDIGNLNSTLKLVASDAHINEYDRNLNGMSCQELIQRFAKAMSDNLEAEKAEVSQMAFNAPSDYEIVRIGSFEQAEEYGDYVSWCVTHDESMFNSYTSNGINQFYFCLKNGFENVEPQPSEGCPLDEYGLSMIAVSVNENGMLNTCTCRWNHGNGGNDNIMNAKQVSQVIGMNFFEVFKPNNKWKELIASVMQRLANGEDIYNVFDDVDVFREGFARVELNRKWNLINQEGRLLSDQWFDYVYKFSEGFASVKLNRKYNFINQEGRLLSDQWFDDVDYFREGFAKVELDGKQNCINQEGRLLSDQWFDDVDDFSEGFAVVGLNGKWNFINRERGLISDQWFDDVTSFRKGSALVQLNGKDYRLDTNGNLTLIESKNKNKKILVSESQLEVIKENFDLEVDSSEIDLSSFKKRHELVPNVWKPSGELNSRIRLKLLDIADDFWKYVNITWVDPKGIILTGSICNFNWSKYSDVDLHLIVDFNEVDEKTEFVKDYLDSKKNEWNNEHKGLEIMGYKVELYVQDIDETPQSNGIYDLEKNEWVKEPNPNDIEPIGLNKYQIKDKAAEIMTIIDNMYDDLSSTNDMHKISEISDDADYLWEKIKKMRSASLEKDGEMGNGNIVYKYMRRKGYLDKLWNLRTMCYDKENSINEGVQYDTFRNNQSARYKLVYDMAEDGYVFHGTGEDGNGVEWDTVDPTKIRGGSRGTYGYGIYFTDHAYKCEKYTTYEDGHYIIANINGFNIINLKERVNKEHNIFLNKQNEYYLLQDKLDKARNNREYDRISSMIDEYNSTVDKKLLNAIIEVIEKSDENDLTYFYLNDNIPLLWYSDGDPKKQLSELYLSLGIDGFKYDTEFVIFNFDKLNKSIVKDKESLINKYKSIPWFNEKNMHLGESVKKYIKLLKQNIINEETVADGSSNSNPYKDMINEEWVADGNANHNPYAKRWKAERQALKNFICNYGTLMQSKENGKIYKCYYDQTLSQLIGYRYCICIQYDTVKMKPKSIVYIRALDKFSPTIRKVPNDMRGHDNVQGTYDDRRF